MSTESFTPLQSFTTLKMNDYQITSFVKTLIEKYLNEFDGAYFDVNMFNIDYIVEKSKAEFVKLIFDFYHLDIAIPTDYLNYSPFKEDPNYSEKMLDPEYVLVTNAITKSKKGFNLSFYSLLHSFEMIMELFTRDCPNQNDIIKLNYIYYKRVLEFVLLEL
jgi:hypothetical protein